MGSGQFSSRRSFLINGLLALPVLAVPKNLFKNLLGNAPPFSSDYTLDVTRYLDRGTDFESVNADTIVADITKDILAANLLQGDWFSNYSQVKAKYFQQGLLGKSSRLLSADKTKLTFLNSWHSKETFLTYFNESSFYKLDEAYIALGLRPKLANVNKIFNKNA